MKSTAALVISVIIIACLGCSSREAGIEVDEAKLDYFLDTYELSRAAFRAQAQDLRARYRNVEIGKIDVRSKSDRNLTIDYCYIPAQERRRGLFIMDCGLHGIEGFAGSAVQRMYMRELLPKANLDSTGMLFLHAINPHGFKHRRKVTEENIDLNRNFDTDRSLFSTKNEGYAILNDSLLNPSGKLNMCSPRNLFFPVRVVYHLLKSSMSVFRQAVMQGQYEFERGIIYGGRDFSPQKADIERLLLKTMKDYPRIFVLDLHTGYGERGKMHFFPNPIKNKKNLTAAMEVFKGYHIDMGSEGDFYVTTGDFTDYIEKLATPRKTCIRMPVEYGTMDSQTILGSIKSLHNYVIENQAAHYGGKSQSDVDTARARMLEHHYPSSRVWRSEIMRQSAEAFPEIVKRFSELR